MTGKEYDKFEKDAFCEKYENTPDTGSNGRTIRGRFETEAIKIFKTWDNFEHYLNNEYQQEVPSFLGSGNPVQISIDFEEDKNSELLKIINSLNDKQIKSKPNLVKSKLIDLKKQGFPFEKVGLDKSLYQLNNNQLTSLFYAARRYANDYF